MCSHSLQCMQLTIALGTCIAYVAVCRRAEMCLEGTTGLENLPESLSITTLFPLLTAFGPLTY
jgi:hypothetical protein